MDLVTVLKAILTSGCAREKLQYLYENVMSNKFSKTAVLTKIYVVVQFYPWFKFYFLLFLGMVMCDNDL